MNLDIRLPMGYLFLIIGAVLVAYGVLVGKLMTIDGTGFNLDLWWGVVLCSFGTAMLLLAGRAVKRRQP